MRGLPGPWRSARPWGQSHLGRRWRWHRSGRTAVKADALSAGRCSVSLWTVPSHAPKGTEDDGRKPPWEPPQSRGIANHCRAKGKGQGVGEHSVTSRRGSTASTGTTRSLLLGKKIISLSTLNKQLWKCWRHRARSRCWDTRFRGCCRRRDEKQEGTGGGDRAAEQGIGPSREQRGLSDPGVTPPRRRARGAEGDGLRSFTPESVSPGAPSCVCHTRTQRNSHRPKETRRPPASESEQPSPVPSLGTTPAARFRTGAASKALEGANGAWSRGLPAPSAGSAHASAPPHPKQSGVGGDLFRDAMDGTVTRGGGPG